VIRYLFQDSRANRGHIKITLILVFFRFVQLFALRPKRSFIWWLGVPFMVFYRMIVESILGVELRPATRVGAGLKIEHGYALVVNDRAVLGKNVHLRHCVTIGCVKRPDGSQGPSPTLEDGVEVGANSVILGDITIGKGAKIGAGCVVVKNVPPGAVVVGNPGRIIRLEESEAV